MKIAITTLGTRGDLQPFVALGVGLKNAGHDVLLVSSKNEEDFAKSFGLGYYALSVDIQKIMDGDEVQKMAKADNPIKFIKSHINGSKSLKQSMIVTQEEVWQACKNTDLIIYHPGMPNGYFIAKELKIPSIMASAFPVTATKDYPSILFYNGPRFGKLYNQLTHFIFEKVFWLISRPALKEFWRKRSMANIISSAPPTRLQVMSGMPVVYGYSAHLFHRPTEWQSNIYITGNWTIENEPNWVPSSELLDFINVGHPPVYFGFGSIKDVSKFKETFAIILEALKISKQRGIIALGWNNLDWSAHLPDNVFLLDNAPHAWLFPKMSVVVHHGGAGTTFAGLNAGKPTVIIPHTADQPAWGRRIYELGVGSKPIPRKKLNAQKLAGAIQTALNPTVVAKAAALSKILQTETGVFNAVNIIDSFIKEYHETNKL